MKRKEAVIKYKSSVKKYLKAAEVKMGTSGYQQTKDNLIKALEIVNKIQSQV